MIDRLLLIEEALNLADGPLDTDVAASAVDETIATVLSLLKRKMTDYSERGNRIGVAVVEDIMKEFYT